MIKIDGSQKSGSGTILRDSIPFSVLTGDGLHMTNIRAKRSKPGLRPQHLKAAEACAEICGGRLEGASVGSTDIVFQPGDRIRGGAYTFNIGTAGSATMLAMAVLPLALFAEGPSVYRITGGLFQDFAPPAFYFQKVLLPVLRRMGIQAEFTILRPGYVPRGGGQIELHIDPLQGKLRPIMLTEQGRITAVKGIALSSLLKDRRVSERMAASCNKILASEGLHADIDVLYDEEKSPVYGEPSPQPGAALMVWAETDTGCVIASDTAGARGRTSEAVGKKTAAKLIQDIRTGATVDRYLADQLIPYAAFAEGKSEYRIPSVTDHVEARLWLIEEFFQTKTRLTEKRLEIEVQGIGAAEERIPDGRDVPGTGR